MPVHARIHEGKFVYRFWGGAGGGYYTPEMSKAQMVQWLLEYNLERTASHFIFDLERYFTRAETIGTSDYLSREVVITEDWREPDEGDDSCIHDDAERYMGERRLMLGAILDMPPFVVDGKKFRISIKVEQLEENEDNDVDEDDGLG